MLIPMAAKALIRSGTAFAVVVSAAARVPEPPVIPSAAKNATAPVSSTSPNIRCSYSDPSYSPDHPPHTHMGWPSSSPANSRPPDRAGSTSPSWHHNTVSRTCTTPCSHHSSHWHSATHWSARPHSEAARSVARTDRTDTSRCPPEPRCYRSDLPPNLIHRRGSSRCLWRCAHQ